VFVHHNRAMQVFLETERLLLRRFTEDDLENLVELDSDPEVMRFITGGRATPREEVANEILPAFLDHYERYAGYGFWAAVEKSTEGFLGWFHFRPADGAPAGRSRARLPPTQIRLGQGLRHRRLASVDRQRVHRVWSRACRRLHDDGERRLETRNGEVGSAIRTGLSPAMAGLHRGRGGGRRRVRALETGVGAGDDCGPMRAVYSIGISNRAMIPGSPPFARRSGSGSRVATHAYPCSG